MADQHVPHEALLRQENDLWRECLASGGNFPDRNNRLLALDAALDDAFDLRPLRERTQLLLAGDWHGQSNWARHVIRRAPSNEDGKRVVVQLGDFGVWPGRSGQTFLNDVAEYLRANDAVCLFLDGNHEDFPQLHSFPLRPDGLRVLRPRLYHLPRGHRWTWNGIRFVALGGGVSIDKARRTPMRDWWQEEEITWAQADAVIAAGPVDVMLTHDVPAEVFVPGLMPENMLDPVEIRRSGQHQTLLRGIVEQLQPTHLWHGHMHVNYRSILTLDSKQPVRIVGLDRDQSMTSGYEVVDLNVLAQQVRSNRLP